MKPILNGGRKLLSTRFIPVHLWTQTVTVLATFCVAEPCSTGIEMVKLISDESRGEVRQAFLFDHIENPGKSKYQNYKYNLKYLKEAFIDYQFSLCG